MVPPDRVYEAHWTAMEPAALPRLTATSRLNASPRPFRGLWADAWRSSVFLILDLPVGIVCTVVTITLIAVSVSLFVAFLVGVPLAWATLRIIRTLTLIECHRFQSVLGQTINLPDRGPTLDSWFRQLNRDVRSSSTWREVGYHVLLLPTAAITWCLVVIGWTLPITLMSAPLVTTLFDGRYAEIGIARIHAGREALGAAAVGIVLAILAPRLMVWLAHQRVTMATALLSRGGTAQLEARVEALTSSRTALVDAVDEERRRIERDLHDGAQQRLVAVAMNLGMAKGKLSKIEGISPEILELIDSAHMESKRAISELRDVARGVHPAILEDRGLGPALSSLAARCPVPVRLDVHDTSRLGRSIEAVAYYVVAESLTNIAKHAQASQVTITVTRVGNTLRVVVSDDGIGGATIGGSGGLGGGLAGLRDRVMAVDGSFALTSPLGGPTTLTTELPCGL
jgi:signal transduction histidine kinase